MVMKRSQPVLGLWVSRAADTSDKRMKYGNAGVPSVTPLGRFGCFLTMSPGCHARSGHFGYPFGNCISFLFWCAGYSNHTTAYGVYLCMMRPIPVINRSAYPLPEYATEHAAGMDLKANIEEPLTIGSLDRVLVPTGIFMALPEGFEAQVRPRSGLAIKHGITMLNSPGTIDADYRGEIKVIVANLSKEPYTIQPGERIAQLVVARFEKVEWQETDELPTTERGGGGFGHSGKH